MVGADDDIGYILSNKESYPYSIPPLSDYKCRCSLTLFQLLHFGFSVNAIIICKDTFFEENTTFFA